MIVSGLILKHRKNVIYIFCSSINLIKFETLNLKAYYINPKYVNYETKEMKMNWIIKTCFMLCYAKNQSTRKDAIIRNFIK